MKLSRQWKSVLKHLAEFGDAGIDKVQFETLYGGGEISSFNPARSALEQMFFTQNEYWEHLSGANSHKIRITQLGKDALDV